MGHLTDDTPLTCALAGPGGEGGGDLAPRVAKWSDNATSDELADLVEIERRSAEIDSERRTLTHRWRMLTDRIARRRKSRAPGGVDR
jgi:hypothetical protein